jgi:hypothetical protein
VTWKSHENQLVHSDRSSARVAVWEELYHKLADESDTILNNIIELVNEREQLLICQIFLKCTTMLST